MNKALLDYFKCALGYSEWRLNGQLSMNRGYFRWGKRAVLYGRTVGGFRASGADSLLHDVSGDISQKDAKVFLPFDPDELAENLLRERYSSHFREEGRLVNTVLRKSYYTLRPCLSVSARKHLQRIRLRNWRNIRFPEWPVDCSVDRLQRRLLSLAMKAHGTNELPFIWFWPEGYRSCAIITHDVEEARGRDLCDALMDVDESYGFHSSFQIVPESRYPTPKSFLSLIKSRGCEVNIHDLRHDGRLYAEHDEFLRRAKQINQYARDFSALGFRSGVLYRNADWYDAYDFQYDMSIPNVAHLDPQRGGCCTVMPYFIGKIVELPVTCSQDYTLFHVLGTYTMNVWREQVELITANHGLVNILVHPDYVMEPNALRIYKSLLAYLTELRDAEPIWTPLPKEVAAWWQQRSKMCLELKNGRWRIGGPGSERARIAYACLADDDVVYRLEDDNGHTYAGEEPSRQCLDNLSTQLIP